ncbi:MAG: glycerophosphodiester phosphodiesterase [Lachnospiraceae bacterium]|nr:glycerophosphodiester phosphodiesterase [Lachnospiraceae bacterium]
MALNQRSCSGAVKIWAHRGANEYAPENTLEAFDMAVRLGADGVELDVHQTRDQEIVVIHDEKLDRTSSGRGFVKDYSLRELRRFDYAKGTKFEGKGHYAIPTLREVFELLKPTGLTINIELKTNVFPYRGIERRILQMAEEFGMRERVWYSSFNRLCIEKIHLLDPKANVGFLYGETFSGMPVLAKNLGLTALHPSFYNLISPHFMEDCTDNGIAVNIWTIDTPEQMRICFRAGVHAIITNYPDRARKILEEMQHSSR